jgi:ABC-type antimicrobial peptide transport system, permease component, putative
LGTQLVLPASMPFYSDWRAYAGLIVLIIFMSLAGGLLSIHRVLKIDPITAIGGE